MCLSVNLKKSRYLMLDSGCWIIIFPLFQYSSIPIFHPAIVGRSISNLQSRVLRSFSKGGRVPRSAAKGGKSPHSQLRTLNLELGTLKLRILKSVVIITESGQLLGGIVPEYLSKYCGIVNSSSHQSGAITSLYS